MKTILLPLLLLLASTLSAEHFFKDKKTSLVWEDSNDNTKLSIDYSKAQAHCENLKIGKYSNFRIPTMDELQSIIDYKKYDSAIIDGFDYVSNEAYWTTTPFANDDKIVWLIHFKKGERLVKDKHYDRYIRCVQGREARKSRKSKKADTKK